MKNFTLIFCLCIFLNTYAAIDTRNEVNFEMSDLQICNDSNDAYKQLSNFGKTPVIKESNLQRLIGYFFDFGAYQNSMLLDPIIISNITTVVSGNTYVLSYTISGGTAPYFANGVPVNGNVFSYTIPCFLAYNYEVSDSDVLTPDVIVSGSSPAGCTAPFNPNWCSTATPLSCDTILNGTTIGGTNDLSYYWGGGCLPTGFVVHAGPDKIYQFNKTEAGALSIGLQITTPGVDLDLFLLNPTCTATLSCVSFGGSNNSINNLEGIFVSDLPIGTYYIVIDSNQPEQQGGFILDIACGNFNCNNVQPILCGVTYQGYSTVYGENSASIYLCDNNTQNVNNSGPEVIYSITTTQQGDITVSLTDMSANLELFLLQDLCNVQSCVGQSFNPGLINESIVLPNAPAGTYYVVVDGFDGQSGNFNITVDANCPQPPPPPGCPTNPLDWEWLQLLIEQTICNPDCHLTVTQYTWFGQTVVDVLFEGICFAEQPTPDPGPYYTTSLSGIVSFNSATGALYVGGGGSFNNNHSVFDCDGNLLFPWGGGLNPNLAEQLLDPLQLFSCICTTTPPFIFPVYICSGSSAALTASGVGYYAWSTGASGQTITVSPTTTTIYTVTVTDFNGCTASSNATVTVFSTAPPIIPPVSICSGSSATLTASGAGYTGYQWSTGSTSQTINISPTTTTIYTVTVTDANGCTASSNAIVTVNNITPPFLVPPPQLCSGGSVTFDSGPGYAGYLWSTGATGQSITVSPSTTTTYTLTVTNSSGCTGSTSTTVFVNPNPFVSILGSTSFCIGGSTTLSTIPSFTSYAWSNGSLSPSITVNTPDNYSVSVTNVNGCTGTASVLVSQNATLSPVISGNLNACLGQTTVLNVGAGYSTYLWSNGANTPSVTVPSGTYSVTVSDASGCTGSTNITVSGLPIPTVSITGSTFFCIGGNAILSAGGGYASYFWSNGASSQSISVNTPGNYSVTVTDVNGCAGTASVIVSQYATLSPVISGNLSACLGQTTVLNVGAGYVTYSWSNGASTPSVTVPSGTYSVTVTDANGCTGSTSVSVVDNSLDIYVLSSIDATCGSNNGSIEVYAFGGILPYTYSWSHNPGLNSPTANALVEGDYTVTITDVNGCSNTLTVTIICFSTSNSIIVEVGGNNSNADHLIQNVLLTGCSQVTNVTYTGHPDAIGYFTNGAGIGISEGVIISSGAATNAMGPNNQTGVTSEFGTPGDSDLTALTSSTPCGSPSLTLDAALIQFTFVPLTTTVQFQYVFASDEYLEWVCSSFNDVFGFFISGPGLPMQNIALIPDTNIPVSINSVNNIVNGQYYNVNPTGSYLTQFDGYTDVMTAVATGLTPCQTYTIKLAVADAGDSILDSAVFLAADSFNAGNIVSVSSFVPSSGMQDAYEGCIDGYFEFIRGDISDLSQPLTLEIIVTGTAIPGLDYEPLPTSINIPAGQLSTQIPILAYDDNSVEGVESVIVQINEIQCDCTLPPSAQINIYDSAPFTSVINELSTVCPGNSVILTVTAVGSNFSPYTYMWSDGQLGSTIFASSLTPVNYTVTVTDVCGRTTTASQFVEVFQQTLVAISSNSSCSETTLLSATPGFFDYLWNTGQTTQSINVTSAGTYIVTVTDANSCTATASFTFVPLFNLIASAFVNPSACNGADGNILVSTSGGSPPYYYSWSHNPGLNSPNASNLAAGAYTVTVTDGNGCTTIASATVPTSGSLVLDIDSTNPTCTGSNSGSIIVNPFGGTPPYSYTWIPNISTNNTATGLTAGTYFVSVSDANGCTAMEPIELNGSNLLTADMYTNNPICNGGNDGTATIIITTGIFPYSYVWSSNTANYNNNTAYNLSAGTYSVTASDINGCSVVLNAVLVNPAQLQANVTTDNANCSGTSTGIATAQVSGGTPPYTYQWSNGQTGATATGFSVGTHSLVVNDFLNCSQTIIFSINEPSSLALSLTDISPTCTGIGNGSITASAIGGTQPYSYEWNNGQTGPVANNLVAGTYTVTVTDNNGCIAVLSTTISAPNAITNTVTSQNITCFDGSNGIIVITPIGGTPPYTYSWLPNVSTTYTATNLPPGNYSVTITDSVGCSNIASVDITQPAPFTANLSTTNILCNGAATGQVSSILTGGMPPYNYLWSNGQTGPVANNLLAGTYSVTVTDMNSCTTTVSATITEPTLIVINATPTAAICYGIPNGSISISVVGGTPGYTYLWNNGQTGTSLPNLLSGLYTVTVTDANGCTVTGDVYVDSPSACDTQISLSSPSCNGGATGSVTVNSFGGVPPYTYLWSNGQSGNTATGLSGGFYQITITDGNGCVTNKSVTVETYDAESPEIIGITNICEGATAQLELTEIYTQYNWSNGAQTPGITITITEAGTYSVTVSDELGCTGSASIDIAVSPQPIAAASANTPVCEGGTISLSGSGGTTYLWTGPLGYISNEQNPVISDATLGSEGAYTLIVTDDDGCESGPASIYIEIQPAPEIDLLTPGLLCSDEVLDLETLLNGSTTGGLWAGSGVFGNLFFAEEVNAGTYQIAYAIPDNGVCPMFSTEIDITVAPKIIFSDHYCVPVSGGYQVFFKTWGGTPPYNINGNIISNEGGVYSSSVINTPTYSILVTDSNDCSKFVIGDDSACSTNCATETIGVITPIDDVCNNGFSIFLTSGPPPPYTFSIDGENWQESDIFTNLEASSYYVYVQHSCGTSIIGTYQAQNSLFSASISLEQTPEGDTIAVVSVSGGVPPYQYLWSTIGLGVDTLINPQLPLSVLVADANGCEVTLSLTDPTTSIGEQTLEVNSINIYPNPTNGVIYIESAISTNAKVMVFDALGREVLVRQTDFKEVVKLDLENKGSGMFFISIQTSDAHIFKKILLY